MAQTRLRAIVDLSQALASLKAWQGAAKIPAAAKIVDELRGVLNRLEDIARAGQLTN